MTRAMLGLLALLSGCDGDQGEERTFEIDCVGMGLSRRGAYSDAITPYPTAETGETVPRCQVFFADVLTQDDLSARPFLVGPGGLEAEGAALSDPDWAVLWVAKDGERWISNSGSVTLTTRENSILVGSYDVELVRVDGSQFTTDTARASGAFDACVPAAGGPDCPASADWADLPEVRIDGPLLEGKGQKVTCRAVRDAETGGLRVDLALATWNGDNVADIWTPQCNLAFGAEAVPTTRFVFHGAGVDGPGTYGPWSPVQIGDLQVPGFTWSYPKTLLGIGDFYQACAVYYEPPATVVPTASSLCTFTLDEDPGRFSLECTETVESAGSGVLTYNQTGDFSLEADCDVVVQ